jgi:hypothetical protein
MEVPITREEQIELAPARAERPRFLRMPVRASFTHGGPMTFSGRADIEHVGRGTSQFVTTEPGRTNLSLP